MSAAELLGRTPSGSEIHRCWLEEGAECHGKSKEVGVGGGPEFTDSGQTSCLSKSPPPGLQTGGDIHLAGFCQER